MKIEKFNEKFSPNASGTFNIEDFKFSKTNVENEYKFDYKNSKVEGNVILDDNSKVSYIKITKGEDLLDDQDIVDLEIFIEDNIDITVNEDSATGGPASAGMGAVVSAQPSSLPGATVGADWISGGGTTGSGDISVPYNPGGADRTFQKIPVSGFSNPKKLVKKKDDKKNQVLDLNEPKLDFTPNTKVMSYMDFMKSDVNVPKKIKQ